MKTTNTTHQLDPVKFLTEHFLKLREGNPDLSMRSFAKEINISATQLSRILSGERKVTYRQMSRILSALNIEATISKSIISGIILKSGKTAKVSKSLRSAASNIAEFTYHSVDRFKMISQWYHFAILELTYLENFESNPEWISKTLNINVIEARNAIERLLELGFLTKLENGKLKKTDSRVCITAEKSDAEIRKYESTMIEKAKNELQKTSDLDYQKRLINSITFPASPELLPELKEAIFDFQKKVLDLIQGREFTQVYHLGCQLFPVSKNDTHTEDNKYESA